MTVQELLAICESADDQDTGSLDAFRAAATVGVVAGLCREVERLRELLRRALSEVESHDLYDEIEVALDLKETPE